MATAAEIMAMQAAAWKQRPGIPGDDAPARDPAPRPPPTVDENGDPIAPVAGSGDRRFDELRVVEDRRNTTTPPEEQTQPVRSAPHIMSVWDEVHGSEPPRIGHKDDDGKTDLSFLVDFPLALNAVARICMYGAEKYGRSDWLHVPNGIARYTRAMFRHIWPTTPRFYLEHSGVQLWELDHEAQIAWNALARLELILKEDGKPKP